MISCVALSSFFMFLSAVFELRCAHNIHTGNKVFEWEVHKCEFLKDQPVNLSY